MSKVTELGYIGIGVSNIEKWLHFANSVVGMESFRDPETDQLYFRLDSWHHRVIVNQDACDDALFIGWRVPGLEEFRAVEAKLKDAGYKFEHATRDEAAARHVLAYLWLNDPDGLRTEIFYGPQVDAHKPFHPGRPMFGRFTTGSQGLGHIIIRQHDIPAAVRFYRLLGFEGGQEYSVPLGGGHRLEPIFMHINSRQHTIGFLPGMPEKRINHLMIEYTELDDLGQTHDWVKRENIPIAMSLGKHANDRALSFYCSNPSGWLFELGWNGRPPLDQHEYYVSDVFGHASEAKGFGVDFDATMS
jgi:2,3-dihydroxybiphenyl 1,2-dioxygenase